MTAARLTTVQNTLQNPGTGKPVAGRNVTIRLCLPGFVNGGTVEKIRTRTVTTDATGLWSVPLEVNDDIDPAGTYYTVHEFGVAYSFVVSYSTDPVTLRSCIVDPANPDPLVYGVQSISGTGVDNTDPHHPIITGGSGGGVSNVALDTDGVPYFEVGASAATISADTDGVPYFQAA
jgi:hypothetical protein